jgi:5-methylcytosine-specific restriction endonuclease McrA
VTVALRDVAAGTPSRCSPTWTVTLACDYLTNRFLEIDHIVPLAEGGRTELTNLWRPCSHHHDLKTYFGWKVVGENGDRDLVPPDDPDPP